MLTKFASAKTAKCDDCKKNKKPINQDIAASVVSASHTSKPADKPAGETKICQCIKCGKDVEVTKFASAAKVMCDECKGITHDSEGGSITLQPLKIDLSKLDKNTMPSIDDYHALPSLISNRRLREVKCPACGHESMRILRVIDWSAFGLIINYQCPNCDLLVNVSEQCNHQLKVHSTGLSYDYSGAAIDNLLGELDSTRLNTTVQQLMKLLNDNNIKIDGIELPPYQFQEERPVPVGFEIPQADRWCKTIQEVVDNLLHGQEYTQALTNEQMANKLKRLFKEDETSGDPVETSSEC
jgi:hypothetical protein